MGHSGGLYRLTKSRQAPHQRQTTPQATEGSKGKRGTSAPGDGSEKRRLVARGRAVHADGLVRNIALAAFHAIVDADLAHRTQSFVVKRGYSESSPQLFVELPQVFKVRCQCRHFKPFVSQKEFLVTRVPQAGEFSFFHYILRLPHCSTARPFLSKLLAPSPPFYAAHSEAQRGKAVDGLLVKPFVYVPHDEARIGETQRAVKLRYRSSVLCIGLQFEASLSFRSI